MWYVPSAYERQETKGEKKELKTKSLLDILGPRALIRIREQARDLFMSRPGYTFFDGISYQQIKPTK